jgi:hypothetical protein
MELDGGNPTLASPSPIGLSAILSGKFRDNARLIEGAFITNSFSPGSLVESRFFDVFSTTLYAFLEILFAC